MDFVYALIRSLVAQERKTLSVSVEKPKADTQHLQVFVYAPKNYLIYWSD